MSYKTRLLSALREKQSKEHGVHAGTVAECIRMAEAIPEDDGISQLKKIPGIFNCTASEPAELKQLFNKTQSWADAERDGRLVVLPCKVGAPVWWIETVIKSNGHGKWVKEKRVNPDEFCYEMLGWIDTPIYLSREEAEAALKGGDTK